MTKTTKTKRTTSLANRRSPSRATKTTKTKTTTTLATSEVVVEDRVAHRSAFEANIAESLRKRGARFDYEGEELEYTLTYVPDFTLKPSGRIIEVKGVLDKETIRKLRSVKRCHPTRDIRLVFQRPSNRLHPGSRTTYAEWAVRNGFPWCGPDIPDDWFK